MNSTENLNEPDPGGVRAASAQDKAPASSSFGEVVVYFMVICFILGVGLLLNEAIRETVSFYRQILGQ